MTRVQRYPWQRRVLLSNVTSCHVLHGNVTSIHVVLGNHVLCRLFVFFGYHPCSIINGTGKLNINIIYSKCHRRWDVVLVLILKLGDNNLLNYCLHAVLLGVLCRFLVLILSWVSLLDVDFTFLTFDTLNVNLTDDSSVEYVLIMTSDQEMKHFLNVSRD